MAHYISADHSSKDDSSDDNDVGPDNQRATPPSRASLIEPQSISAALKSCMLDYKHVVDSASLTKCTDEVPPDLWQEQYTRLQRWGSNIGAYAQGVSSLEHRLREAPSILQHVNSLIRNVRSDIVGADSYAKHLRHDIEQEESQSNSDSDSTTMLHELYASIDSYVTDLLKVSIMIRNSQTHEKIMQLDSDTVAQTAPWFIQYVREKFPDCSSLVCERLGRAIARRRAEIEFRRKQAERGLARFLGESDHHEEESQTPTKFTDYAEFFQPQDTDIRTEATSQSGYSDLETANVEGGLRVAQPPHNSDGGKPFDCPYCFNPTTIHQRNDWPRHVLRDALPYICVFARCETGEKLYASRREFFKHLRRAHGPRFEIGTAQPCLLCQQYPSESISMHISHHLIQLALFSLLPYDAERDEDRIPITNHDVEDAELSSTGEEEDAILHDTERDRPQRSAGARADVLGEADDSESPAPLAPSSSNKVKTESMVLAPALWTSLFAGVIQGVESLYALRIFRSLRTRDVRLEAAILKGPLKNTPIWVASITHLYTSPSWLQRKAGSRTVHLTELKSLLLNPDLAPSNSDLRFETVRDAEEFEDIVRGLARDSGQYTRSKSPQYHLPPRPASSYPTDSVRRVEATHEYRWAPTKGYLDTRDRERSNAIHGYRAAPPVGYLDTRERERSDATHGYRAAPPVGYLDTRDQERSDATHGYRAAPGKGYLDTTRANDSESREAHSDSEITPQVTWSRHPYQCSRCPESFRRDIELRRHERIHSSVRPYPCHSCDKSFSTKDALKRHLLVSSCSSRGSSGLVKPVDESKQSVPFGVGNNLDLVPSRTEADVPGLLRGNNETDSESDLEIDRIGDLDRGGTHKLRSPVSPLGSTPAAISQERSMSKSDKSASFRETVLENARETQGEKPQPFRERHRRVPSVDHSPQRRQHYYLAAGQRTYAPSSDHSGHDLSNKIETFLTKETLDQIDAEDAEAQPISNLSNVFTRHERRRDLSQSSLDEWDVKVHDPPPRRHAERDVEDYGMRDNDDDSRSRTNSKLSDYFVESNGIEREVIQHEICRYLGNDATVRALSYTNKDGREGYIIRAYRPLTLAMIEDLRKDSARWRQEQAPINNRLSSERSDNAIVGSDGLTSMVLEVLRADGSNLVVYDVMLDSGSDRNYISEKCAADLGYSKENKLLLHWRSQSSPIWSDSQFRVVPTQNIRAEISIILGVGVAQRYIDSKPAAAARDKVL